MAMPEARWSAVYDTRERAQQAAEAARRAGAPTGEVRIGDELDAVVALQGEMREEMEHTIAAPGNVGPFTKEMTKGMVPGMVLGGAIGAVLALPLAAIELGGWPLWLRLVVAAGIGALVGGTVGWILGGSFGARRGDEPLAAERGVTVTAPGTEPVRRALEAAAPIRLDAVAAGHPVATATTDEDRQPGIAHDIGRNLAREERES